MVGVIDHRVEGQLAFCQLPRQSIPSRKVRLYRRRVSRLYISNYRIRPEAEGHVAYDEVERGKANADLETRNRQRLDLQILPVIGRIAVDHRAADAREQEGLIVAIVVVIDTTVHQKAALQTGPLPPSLVVPQRLRRIPDRGIWYGISGYCALAGRERSIVRTGFYTPIDSQIPKQILCRPVIELRFRRPEPAVHRAVIRGKGRRRTERGNRLTLLYQQGIRRQEKSLRQVV